MFTTKFSSIAHETTPVLLIAKILILAPNFLPRFPLFFPPLFTISSPFSLGSAWYPESLGYSHVIQTELIFRLHILPRVSFPTLSIRSHYLAQYCLVRTTSRGLRVVTLIGLLGRAGVREIR